MKIAQLLEAIKELEVVIPEFQREYVWNLDQSKELMVSLFNNYPTGSILIWETNNPPEIKNNAVKKDKMGWIKVLLDGQQRITTLYLFIKGKTPQYYTEKDIMNDPRHLYFNLQTAEFNYYQKQKMKDNPFWKSVVDCFNEKFDAFTLMENLKIEDGQEKLKIGQIVNQNLNKLRGILDIDYFIQSVPHGVTIDEAIDIFDRVNSQGTKLTDAELVLTHIAGKWPQVRREMKKQIEEYEKVGFLFELDFLTRCTVVLLTSSALFEKMTDEIYQKITEEDYKNNWAKLVKIFNYLIPILKQSAYMGGSEDLNTNNVLVPIIAHLSVKGGSFKSINKNMFLYWMFLASIWGRYSGQTDQRLDRDVYLAINSQNPVDDLISEIEDQRGRTEIKPSDLEGRGSGHPIHRMLYMVSKYNKATDWANGGSLQDTMGDYYNIHSHHIFPQAFLYKNGYDSENHLDKKKVNEIANKAFITRDTNFDISDKDPKDYLQEVKEKYPEALAQQLIPDDKNMWDVKGYESFLIARRKLIADAINSFLQNIKGEKEEAKEKIDYNALIAKGENNFIEFKSSLRWDYEKENVNKLMEYVIAKTLSAFMNSEGGKLFIGIDDSGKVLGIEKDCDTLKKKNNDGFLLQLTQVINQYLGKEFHQYLNQEIVNIDNKDVCVVNIVNSDMPVFVKNEDKEEFYIRASASSQPMSMREANNYIKTHWDND
ncbi:MAG: DUF262 domain-containing protein [Candidatus Omnitrophota bacterium]|nr:DUF262 domain-containing protein [Candidatus Omnitrophota bacterium]